MNTTVTAVLDFMSIALSLGCSYAPGLKVWFEGLEPVKRAAVQAGLILLVVLCLFGYAALNGQVITLQTIVDYFLLFVNALVANQGTHMVNKPFIAAIRRRRAVNNGSSETPSQ